jgi:1-deoxy-D-xylulose-5-phosphate reductoisomerase
MKYAAPMVIHGARGLGDADIAEVCARVLDEHPFQPDPSLDDVRRLDAWARQEVVKWACV